MSKWIDTLVDKFLSWPLPRSVCSDTCVCDSKYPHQRVGTNLLTADEARQMFEYIFAPSPPQAELSEREKSVLQEAANVLDHYELLANDIKSDPGMDNLNAAMQRLYHAAEGNFEALAAYEPGGKETP